MRFGPTPLADAEAAILAHGFRLPGRALKKGQRLSAGDIAALGAAGYDSVVTARLDPHDVAENDAARELAEALAGAAVPGRRDGVRAAPEQATGDTLPRRRDGAGAVTRPVTGNAPTSRHDDAEAVTKLATGNAFTGRCNLLAAERGLFCVDEAGVAAVNAVGEELTLATLSPLTVVDPRRLVATVKVIPFAVRRSHLDACLEVVREHGGIIRIASFRPRRAGLVLTVLPGFRDSILDKTASVLRDTLEGVGASLETERRCAHSVDAVTTSIEDLVSGGYDLIVVLGASAIVDRRDVVPAAVEAAGGTVHRLGLPVDPGNLCLYARIGEVPLVGLPGSSRSPVASGADLLLRRIGADLPLTEREFAAWGTGGLLKEQRGRPSPRSAPADADAVASPPRANALAVIVLAAGQSRRMGRRNKLLEPVEGEPMVRHAVLAAASADAGFHVVVVTGHERGAVEAALAGFDVAFVHNPDYGAGLSTSLARGVAALPDAIDGAVVCLADMPGVRARHLERLRDAFDPESGAAICVATHRGKRGNPVLFASRFFPEMCDVEGDVGARHLIGAYAELVREVEMEDEGVLLDIDSPRALEAYRAGDGGSSGFRSGGAGGDGG